MAERFVLRDHNVVNYWIDRLGSRMGGRKKRKKKIKPVVIKETL